jgi:AAA15 family ATPase/GTPase
MTQSVSQGAVPIVPQNGGFRSPSRSDSLASRRRTESSLRRRQWLAGYQMIESFQAENFRSFRNLKLNGLPAVNILVGKSASGKTALLEAIRLALGATPTIAFTLNGTRGLAVPIQFNPTKDQFEAIWRSYFPDFDITKTISFKIMDSDRRVASLSMYFDLERPVTPTTTNINIGPGQPILTNTIIPLAFKRTSFTGEESTLDATVHQQQHGQLFLQQGGELGTVSEFFPSTWQSNAQLVANWFSQLKISNRSSEIVEIIHRQFPEITELSSENPYGIASVYATVKHHSEMMPISLVSSGINKFVSILLAMRTYRGGVVLIDEIENGIYYRMFPALWAALHKFATTNKTQLFMSTHSWECLQAAATVIDKHPNDFALIQVSHENGVSNADVAPGKKAAAAIESEIEVRK